jgi:hypothetical protein
VIPKAAELQGASKMNGKTVIAGVILASFAGLASAQNRPIPEAKALYCAGEVTSQAVPQDTFVITGEQASESLVFITGQTIFVNKGAKQGVKVGDQFSVIRPVIDPVQVDWTKSQSAILKKMGTVWEDEGRITVTEVRPDVSFAQIDRPCDTIQRGDILVPFVERAVPPIKTEPHFDRWAPANGKPLAMVVVGRKFAQEVGANDVAYVNLGSQQGVKVGDYFRIFRYAGGQSDVAYQTPRFAFDVDKNLGPTYGFGGVSKEYNWSNVPREDIGEAVVLRTTPNSSSILVTTIETEIYPGDYVELE